MSQLSYCVRKCYFKGTVLSQFFSETYIIYKFTCPSLIISSGSPFWANLQICLLIAHGSTRKYPIFTQDFFLFWWDWGLNLGLPA
jgi:hypothetical protein